MIIKNTLIFLGNGFVFTWLNGARIIDVVSCFSVVTILVWYIFVKNSQNRLEKSLFLLEYEKIFLLVCDTKLLKIFRIKAYNFIHVI